MSKINTVLGTINSKDLGFTLMHEHISIVDPAMRNAFKTWFNKKEVIKNAVRDIKKAQKLGVQTIIDATPICLGRDLSILQEVSKLTGVNIIATTGCYWSDEPWMLFWEPEQIADYLLKEITTGMEGTTIKPGIIKAGTESTGVTPYNYKVLKIAALLHLKTGLPITTHASVTNQIGLLQQDVFEASGVDLSHVIIGHCGDTTDIYYLEKILHRGSYIGLDRFGLGSMLPDNLRIETLVELCNRGYAKQLILSHDYCSFIDFVPNRKMIEENFPAWNYSHLCQNIIPELKKKGITEKQIKTMMIDNPRRIFEQ